MKKITATIIGISPLLMNRMSEDQLLNLRLKKKKPKGHVSQDDPRKEAQAKIHTDCATGKPCIPANMLMSALIGGGQFIRLDGKRQLSTKNSTVLPGLLILDGTHFPLTPTDWEVDIQQGRNPNGGEAVCIIRPRFDKWGFKVTFILDEDGLSEGQARELFDIALSRVGLGDFRPQRKGTFGRSRIDRWEVITK